MDSWGDRVEGNIGTGVRRSGGENERRDGGTGSGQVGSCEGQSDNLVPRKKRDPSKVVASWRRRE